MSAEQELIAAICAALDDYDEKRVREHVKLGRHFSDSEIDEISRELARRQAPHLAYFCDVRTSDD